MFLFGKLFENEKKKVEDLEVLLYVQVLFYFFIYLFFKNLEMNFKLAYLMEHENMSMIEALAAIVKARPIVSPNCGCKTKFYQSFI